ncbi:MAG: Polyketide biosynthesis malonyl CoA-acyl carrier protein transacylase PksC [Luteibacter sp.]|uniref:ACP S-malonyltransferase n=1 Tax=Luteibacter sp. TaxID=1886636 RepID=UPI001384124A|nr:MAG: Polyketide biosynthesis malonyl CoA-acyl carrier protein transacylase PksC [Luteibacter sp.]
MKTYMFPGQGSQAKGMGGAALFDAFAVEVAQADDVLGYSIRELCLEDPRSELDNTQFTQPALFVVNALSFLARRRDGHALPDFLAGHSLGEFNALHAAGCFDFATGVRLVRKRGELMSQASGGAMAAVVNADPAAIEATLRENGLDRVYLANFNTPVQIVISGDREQVAAAQPLLQKGRVLVFPLKTSGAFHTPFMADAQKEFEAFLEGVTFMDPAIPVVANISALPYEATTVAATLASQIASPVRWAATIAYLVGRGEAADSMAFEEIGHGDVLTKMLRANGVTAKVVPPAVVEAAPSVPAAAPAVAVIGKDAAGKVEAWNRQHPVGTRVVSSQTSPEPLRTRTEAILLFGHRAAVYLDGYEGYFDLDDIAVA